ncbi:MAG: hypothetical protein HXS54_00300 [Theionarchaea archaeon]|nr:hypothetical protein [Theionarchaea archaeon]
MDKYDDVMDQIKYCAEEFMERNYPDEAPYFDVAWDTFTEVLQSREDAVELKGPALRGIMDPIKGDDTVMAPMVIRAFHILFTMTVKPESHEPSEQEILDVLSQWFSLEFSMEIVDFFMEHKDEY